VHRKAFFKCLTVFWQRAFCSNAIISFGGADVCIDLQTKALDAFGGAPQGCQIFLGTKYQNGKQYTKLP
jgi:hypothetical protein